ncbi:acetate kinase [Arthrobacter crystallopoietes BAB-32]|uniref:Acetate kinase n=1 Tax=Arthrobacter crystallopoietes BAB-32 TaxID=1246476 RepID=N1V400_9MICC|nr:acetate kinase [Arthrobacter crystallopoietes]EMY32978.1 acetate kinase [Arthrobacter crystallopoietes BAB-32]
MLILVINSGSSSLKYQVRRMDPDSAGTAGEVPAAGIRSEVLADGSIEEIGEREVGDHGQALDAMVEQLEAGLGRVEFDAVGHRVVHGGTHFDCHQLIDDDVLRTIDELAALAPLHNPPNAEGIRAAGRKWPGLPQVAVFDTVFHRTLPEHAWRYALPAELQERHGLRRFGFHGSSFEYVTREAARLLGTPLEKFDAVIAHVGNGASATAISGGRSVDTSMGFTPLEGLVMGTRPGDLDPGLLLYLQQQGYGADRLQELLNRDSGLKGLAGSNDMRSIVKAAGEGDSRADMALAVASYRLAKYIGAYHVACGGADALVFTAGIGEHSAEFRRRTVDRLDMLGVRLDADANAAAEDPQEPCTISAAESVIPVLVVPTEEEQIIAEATAAVVTSR